MPGWLIPVVVLAELVGGLLIGVLVGVGARWLMPRLALPAAGLYPVAVIALLLLTYGLAVELHTSGFAAVYVLALILAASPLPHRRAVLGFVEGLAWAVQIGLFIMLGLLVVPSRVAESLGIAALAGVLLLVVARPLSVVASMAPFLRPGWATRVTRTAAMPWQWAAFASWAGLRGAVPIVFATIPLGAVAGDGAVVFDVTMLLVVALTLLQSPTMPVLARRLGLVRAERAGELTVEAAPLDTLRAALLDLDIPAGSRIAGTYISELPLPPAAVVSLVVRDERSLVPDRHTRVKVGDRLLIVVTESARAEAERALRSVSTSGRLSDWVQRSDPE
jgi:cell volume regulation protein A